MELALFLEEEDPTFVEGHRFLSCVGLDDRKPANRPDLFRALADHYWDPDHDAYDIERLKADLWQFPLKRLPPRLH